MFNNSENKLVLSIILCFLFFCILNLNTRTSVNLYIIWYSLLVYNTFKRHNNLLKSYNLSVTNKYSVKLIWSIFLDLNYTVIQVLIVITVMKSCGF